MKKRAALLLTAAMLLTLSGCGTKEPEAAPETALAAETKTATEPEGTTPATTEALYDLSTWQVKCDLGLSYLCSKEWQLAYDAFDAAVNLDPQQPDAYAQRGLARVCLEETEETMSLSWEDYQQALALDDGCALAYRGIADVHIRRGEYEDVRSVLQSVVEKSQDPAVTQMLSEFDQGVFADSAGTVRFRQELYYNRENEYIGCKDTYFDVNGASFLISAFDSNGKSMGSVETGTVIDGNVELKTTIASHINNEYIYITKVTKQTTTHSDGSYDIVQTHYDTNGKIEKSNHSIYDSLSHCIRSENYDANTCLTGYDTYEYDDAGNATRIEHYDTDDAMINYELREYNAQGKLIKQSWFWPDGSSNGYFVYLYDENGKTMGHESYDENGNLSGYTDAM